MRSVRIAAAQTPEFIENVDAALDYASQIITRAEAVGAALLCFPEGFLQGYLTDEARVRHAALDLGSPAFAAVLDRFPKTGPMIVTGLIEIDNGRLFNSAIVIHRGALVGRYRKAHLLKGERIFDAGNAIAVFDVDGLRFGINICNDTNFPEEARNISGQGASILVVPANNLLPYRTAETFRDMHNAVRGERCRETGLWLVSADITGERDGCVSWGPTAVLDPEGRVVAQLPLGEPGLLVCDIPDSGQAFAAR